MIDSIYNPEISLNAVRKSGRVIYAFKEFYLPFYVADEGRLFMSDYDLFGGVSAAIYQIDDTVERDEGVGGEALRSRLKAIGDYIFARIGQDSFISEKLEDAEQYYAFERMLKVGGSHFTLQDLARITSIRSFDFRILHRILLRILGVDKENAGAWLNHFEQLMEIEDDLSSIEEDLSGRSFNFPALAYASAGASGAGFFVSYRDGLLLGLTSSLEKLSLPEQNACKQVFEKYRAIVTAEYMAHTLSSMESVNCEGH